MRRAVLLFTLAVAAGCGDEGSPPELSEITLSKSAVRRQERFFATVHAIDRDGDMDEGLILIKATSMEDDSIELENDVNVYDVDRGATEAELILALSLYGDMPLGTYELSLVLVDNGGTESQPSTIPVRCTQ